MRETERKVFNVVDYGAAPSASPAANAGAIQAAIDAAAAKGGKVVVPAGEFTSGTLWLRSEVELHLEEGAVLKASPDFADYNAEDAYPENFGCPKSEYWRGLHFIIAYRQQYVAITGKGVIDGNGDHFFDERPIAYFDWMKPTSAAWWNGIRWAKDKQNLRPGQLVVFVETRGISVVGVTIRNSPCWSLFFHACTEVEVRDYTCRNGQDDGNTDGIDIDCCQGVEVDNVDIDTGDDAIAIRASGRRLRNPSPCERIRISNCRLASTSSVFRIGVGEGTIRDVVVENVETRRGGTAVNMSTLYGDPEKFGVDIENVTFRNCDFTCCREGYRIHTEGKALKFGVRDITFERCDFPEGKPSSISSAEGCPFKPENIRFVGDRKLEAAVAEELTHVVRPGGVDGQEFWNGHSEWFMYPPSFAFSAVEGAVKYRFLAVLDNHREVEWEATAPTEPLTSVWERIPAGGFVTLFCHGVSSAGGEIGLAGRRVFWKTAAFHPGWYPPAARPYSKAAEMIYDYVFAMPSTRHWLETGLPDPGYHLNCYPSKMHAAMIRAMVKYARMRPDRAADALKIAHAAADYLIAHAEPAGSPLEFFTQTYEGAHYTAGTFAGQHMLLYPQTAASAFLVLSKATGEAKYLEAAERIAATYLRLQGEDGTCFLKMRAQDGTPVNPNRCFPLGVCGLLEELFALTGKPEYRAAADRGFAFVEKGPLADWNWEGQFEDVKPSEKFVNLTKHPACETLLYILKRFPGDNRRLAQAREIIRFSEDQFIAWERPSRPDGAGMRNTVPCDHYREGRSWDSNYLDWILPGVMEQYHCYVPIDSSAAKLIRAFVALWKAGDNPLDLAKARALGDAATRVQEPSGRLRTFWTDQDAKSPERDWINCMLATAGALELLGSLEEERKDGNAI